ncbi:MAG: Rpn family recombination-promoting nuclease/putative transposase [Spirochaetota bacterium]
MQLLKSFVDQPWIRGVDFSKAERVDKSFVTGRFRRLESDMVWKLPVQGETVYLHLLLEFQSKVDRYMALRMLRYILEFSSTLVPGLQKGKRLPAVFPLMLYNGDAPWTAPVELSELIETGIAHRRSSCSGAGSALFFTVKRMP